MKGGPAARLIAGTVVVSVLVALAWPDGVDRRERATSLDKYQTATDRLPAIHIDAYEFGFEPSNLLILVGQVVSWRAVGEEPHLVTPRSPNAVKAFDQAGKRGTVRHVFEKPGVYRYYCSIHPRMRGKVTVVRKLD